METVETLGGMSDVVYVLVDDAGKPDGYGEADEANISVYGDFWRAWREPTARSRQIRALAVEDLQELLRDRWSHVTHVIYFPSVTGFQLPRERIFEIKTA